MALLRTTFIFHGVEVEVEGRLIHEPATRVAGEGMAGTPEYLNIEDIKIVGEPVIVDADELTEAALDAVRNERY